MMKGRFSYLTDTLGTGAIVALVVAFIVLQVTSIHGVALLLGVGYVAAFFITIFAAGIIPFSEFAIVGIGIYGLVDLVIA